ncbi:cpr-5 [Symbiodinium natans]|uniref:Cpr-5 protein n=1 Tax=Symbiodinium natans TaxID=878477 RepID=A0A812L1U8_9DINO|nr:cpr-5 [Symbiodinium natans]
MFVITDDGPKLPWELDEDGHAGSKPAQVEAQDRSGAPSSPPGGPARTLGHRETGSPSEEPRRLDASLMPLAEKGDSEALDAQLRQGCEVNIFVSEFRFYPGSFRMYGTDWTPLTAAVAGGHLEAARVLLEVRADVNVVCCCCTASGPYSFWTALDIARTGDAVPYERDPEKQKQPRHPEIEKLLLAACAKPSSKLPEPPRMNTYGNPAEKGERKNPCLDEQGFPLRPEHLYTEEVLELIGPPGAPKFSNRSGGGGGCPMSSMGMFGIGTSVDGSRIYTGEASWTKVERRLDD